MTAPRPGTRPSPRSPRLPAGAESASSASPAPRCRDIGEGVLGALPPPRVAIVCGRSSRPRGEAIDEGLALYFPAPHSSPARTCWNCRATAARWCSTCCCACPRARRAPGRTRRVHATGVPERQARPRAGRGDRRPHRQRLRAAARAALRSLRGEFSTQVHELTEALLGLRMWVEAAIDFPEEEIDFLADRALGERMARHPRRGSPSSASRAPGRAAAGRAHARDRRAAECRQVEPAESPGRLRRRHRHADPRHDARRAARTHRDRRLAAAHPRHRGPARLARRSRGRGDPPGASGDGARRPRAFRRRCGGPGSGWQPSRPISPRCRRRPRARW